MASPPASRCSSTTSRPSSVSRGLYLEDLFVRPRFRGVGLGRLLMAFLARLALERGCGRFEWSVLDWNSAAIRFYRDLGAAGMDEWTRAAHQPAMRCSALAGQFDSATQLTRRTRMAS